MGQHLQIDQCKRSCLNNTRLFCLFSVRMDHDLHGSRRSHRSRHNEDEDGEKMGFFFSFSFYYFLADVPDDKPLSDRETSIYKMC